MFGGLVGVSAGSVRGEVVSVPVVIVGAGPVGVLASIQLARYGVESLVLERWEAPYPRPRAVHLDDEVARILTRAGVGPGFRAISRPALGLRLVERDLRLLAEFRRSDTAGVHGHPQASMFDQPDLERLLRAELARHSAATLRGGCAVTSIRPGPGHVDVHYTEQASGAGQSVRAAWVLGCDGANSLVREQIGAAMTDLGFEQRWLVVDAETSADLHQWEGVQQVCDPHRPATFLRIGATRYRWEFRLRPGEQAADFASAGDLEPLLRPWTAPARPPDLTVLRCAEYTFRAQVADRWRSGRVFLLGDAAHLTPPFTGQGLGAGLRDAANLTWKLAGVWQGGLPEATLDSYQSEREPHARAMIRLAVLVGRLMSGGGRAGALLRRWIAPRLHLLPGLRARILDSATPPLHRSALAERPGWPGWHRRIAGRLGPNAAGEDGVRPDDRAAGFTVVTRVPVTGRLRAEVEERGGALVIAAPGSAPYRWLRRGRASVAVLRPDGTLFTAGRDPAAVCSRLPGFPVLLGAH
jgi:3-(3-hydroxy-phenyl)propionate hydroxylase